MKDWLSLLRIHQYIKNIFIFLPLFFALKVQEWHLFGRNVVAFVLFSMAASAIYIFNDFRDVAEDRLHPSKQFRPLASGAIAPKHALIFAALLMLSCLALSAWFSMPLFYILAIYITLNIVYSLKLKHISILDVNIIAVGFVLRLYAGAAVSEVPLTVWIILMTFLLALFLGFAKRRDDVLLAQEGKQTRKNINGYNIEFINASMVIMAAVVIVCYVFYTISPDVQLKFKANNLYLTVFFVILGILRYLQITFVENRSGSPTKLLLRDMFLQLTILAWFFTFAWLIYGQ